MTPRFAQAIDPIFLYVLDLLDRIGRGEKTVPPDERLRIRALIDQAEAVVGAGPEWDSAKYALASWIDEVLVDTPWDGRVWWSNNVLEMEYYSTRTCFEQFYMRAQEATTLARRDALEVYYVCAVLGFRGLYRDPATAESFLQAYGLPPDIEAWAKQAAMSIRLGQKRPALSGPRHELSGAPPLRARSLLVWCWWSAFMLGACNLLVLVLFWFRA
ncbi:MAG: DotU family type IV/VI secretion system protein [Planctomycetota bacterium]|nr:DotU family type IV/VI secretion system protein [Planctomycetota bacterium]